jgi:hypothetical protein
MFLDFINNLYSSFYFIFGNIYYTFYEISYLTERFIWRNPTPIEKMIIYDSIFNVVKFITEYTWYKLQIEKTTGSHENKNIYVTKSKGISKYVKLKYTKSKEYYEKISHYRSQIINSCKNLYFLSTLDRYSLYLFYYCVIYLFNNLSIYLLNFLQFLKDDVRISNYTNLLTNNLDKLDIPAYKETIYTSISLTTFLITIPHVQYFIFYNKLIRPYTEYLLRIRGVFIKYTISKLLLIFIANLDDKISSVRNYDKFIVYREINWSNCITFVKSYCFLLLLCYLRSDKNTYYIYKAIKLSNFVNSGYVFNVLDENKAVTIINMIIKNRNWKKLLELESINAIHTLYYNKQEKLNIYWYYFYFITIWSCVYIFRLFGNNLKNFLFLFYCLGEIVKYNYGNDNNDYVILLKKIFITSILYFFVIINSNDIIVSFLFVFRYIFYYVLVDLLFFVKNYKLINDTVKFYKNYYTY